MNVLESLVSNFLTIMKTFEVKDVIDILCITIVIYALIKFVRETRAEQLLKGVIILLAIYFLSYTFGLTMFTALLKNFFEFGVIILFIIFQPELRKALERIGRSKISKSFSFLSSNDTAELVTVKKKTIQDVSDAAIIFSRSKVGALIVFERTTKLGDIINTGTVVDAASSVAVIGNLFFNKAPLHDGAVIIRDGKIYAAGCILPLTRKNEDVDPNLGTRHRAGLGMSEESDAVVIIVSEETGNISMAYRGRLTRIENKEELIKTLERYILPTDTKTDIVDLIPIFSSKRKEKKNGK
ncbi:MAG TPA: TIGR00159 family protein [Clostridiales bacterium]|nr:TIGR00159 family protein [Clostridiales bacterium]